MPVITLPLIAFVLGLTTCPDLLKAEEVQMQLKNVQLKHVQRPNSTVDINSTDETVNADFPHPTQIRDVAKAFSLWFGTEYVVDEAVQTKVILNSPEPVKKEEALLRFRKMLKTYRLKAISNGVAYRIVSTNEKAQ